MVLLTWFHILVKEWLFTSENDESTTAMGMAAAAVVGENSGVPAGIFGIA